jgi:hypothetical protein
MACAEEVLPSGHIIQKLGAPPPDLVDQMSKHLASIRLPSFSPLDLSSRASEVAQVRPVSGGVERLYAAAYSH